MRIDAETDKEATEENRQSIIAERENALYEEVVKKWQENDSWDYDESMLEDIDFRNSFTMYEDEEGTESEDATEIEDATETEDVAETEDATETVDGTESN